MPLCCLDTELNSYWNTTQSHDNSKIFPDLFSWRVNTLKLTGRFVLIKKKKLFICTLWLVSAIREGTSLRIITLKHVIFYLDFKISIHYFQFFHRNNCAHAALIYYTYCSYEKYCKFLFFKINNKIKMEKTNKFTDGFISLIV